MRHALRAGADDVLFCDLTACMTDDEVVPSVAQALGISRAPRDVDPIVAALEGRGPTIVVIDRSPSARRRVEGDPCPRRVQATSRCTWTVAVAVEPIAREPIEPLGLDSKELATWHVVQIHAHEQLRATTSTKLADRRSAACEEARDHVARRRGGATKSLRATSDASG